MKSFGAIEENVIYWMNGKQIPCKAVAKFDFILFSYWQLPIVWNKFVEWWISINPNGY